MSNDVKKRVPNENEKVRTIKKEITELIKPLAQALERLQALRCSVDSVFNFLQGLIKVFKMLNLDTLIFKKAAPMRASRMRIARIKRCISRTLCRICTTCSRM